MAKYEKVIYKTGYLYVGININIYLITFEDNIVVPSVIQRYLLHWYHTYLLHLVMDRTEAVIPQTFTGPEF